MKPISLHGHERSITQIVYNREGDLLFSSAKDQNPNVWYSINGERLGTYDGHGGAVWCIDVDWETKNFLSGAADNTIRLWDVCTGKMTDRIDTRSAVRTCQFSYSGNMVAYSTDRAMGQQCVINIVDVRTFSNQDKTIMSLPIPAKGPKVTSLIWNGLDDLIVTGHDNGDIVQWDVKTHQKVKISSEHQKSISDLQLSSDRTMFISASKDTTAKLWDMDQLENKKTYKTERPVNSAAISPNKDHVVLGGGQEAASVTTTTTREKFDSRFFHLIFEEEFGTVKGHFGPINSLRFHPDGKSYASGGEDGYVRINHFDNDYHAFKVDY